MTNVIILVSKYLILVLMGLYTFLCYTVVNQKEKEDRNFTFLRQNTLMFFIHFVAFTILYLEMGDITVLIFYGEQVAYLIATLILFRIFYPNASRLLVNNMCMLITIGFIMITRLSYERSFKQFLIVVISTVVALIVPVLIRKLRFITRMYGFYTLMGIGMLALVAIMAQSTYGAKLSFTVGGVSIQPSEFVKIIYVFAIAGLLSNARNFRKIVIATILAALHVLILVVSKDLGSALIFFVTYLVMLFVSTRNPYLVLIGILAGAVAAVGAYFLFYHVRVRVMAWRDPFQDYYVGGYQISQSLFSIAAGGWLGTGLYQGSPRMITFVEQDFMFSAIAEELGSFFGICLILVCMSCFRMFVNISMQMKSRFYRLVAIGLGSVYATQVFLTVGGGIKLIPLTGVTLPLVSYGGSSALSTILMFSIVQGMYILHRDEEQKKQEQILAARQASEAQSGYAQNGEYDYSYSGQEQGYEYDYYSNGYPYGTDSNGYGSEQYPYGTDPNGYGKDAYPYGEYYGSDQGQYPYGYDDPYSQSYGSAGYGQEYSGENDYYEHTGRRAVRAGGQYQQQEERYETKGQDKQSGQNTGSRKKKRFLRSGK